MANHRAAQDEDLAQILTPPARRTLAHEVMERLRDAILRNQLRPGQQLRENSLAESMGVSRGPVREALIQLEREGLILRERNRTAMVARLSRKDLDEIHSLRVSLEGLAVTCACRNATTADLDVMQDVIEAMTREVNAGLTEQEGADLDLRFHDLLYRSSRHDRLQAIWSTLRHQVYLILLNRNAANPNYAEILVEGHRDILDAIRARDEAKARAVAESHLRFAYETVLAGRN